MRFTLYNANCREKPQNCNYHNKIVVTDEATLASAVQCDYVAAEYLNSYRSVANFVKSDCLVMDIDNDHSEDHEDWKTPDDVRSAFPDVAFAVHYSRNNMKPKGNKSPRPKFHVFFPIDETTSAEQYTAMKHKAAQIFPYFDKNALDAGRFFFGTQNPQVAFFAGNRNLTAFLDEYHATLSQLTVQTAPPAPPATPAEISTPATDNVNVRNEHLDVIPQGTRNSTLLSYAEKVLKHYGATDTAYRDFLDKAKHCKPLLDDGELHDIWERAKRFYMEQVFSQKNYVNPELFDDNPFMFEPHDYTDAGQTEIFVREYHENVRYSTEETFFVYNGTLWDEDLLIAQRCVKEFTKRQLDEAEYVLSQASENLRECGISINVAKIIEKNPAKEESFLTTKEQKAAFRRYIHAKIYHSFVLKNRSANSLKNILSCCKPDLRILPDDFNANPYHLNTPGGTVDLRTGEIHSHNPKDLITKQTSIAPSSTGSRIWMGALNEFFCGDWELIQYAQMIAGFAAIGLNCIEKMIIAHGTGANGKSTFFNSLQQVLGTYADTVSSDIFAESCTRNVMPEFAKARGKRLLLAPELDKNSTLNSSILKRFCSADRVRGEGKFKDPEAYKPSHTVVLMTNFLPRIDFFDFGTVRRIVLLPFNATFTAHRDRTNYSEYLVQNAGGAILSWIIEGARKVLLDDFSAFKGDAANPFAVAPKAVQALIENYDYSSDYSSNEIGDGISAFINDCCEVGDGYEAGSMQLYSEYRRHCSQHRAPRMTQGMFNNALNERFEHKMRHGRHYYQGLRLSTQ